jgi:predicted transcriptional regulator
VTWKVRASTKLDTIVDELAKREGRTRSALIRDAVAEYARSHRAV